MIRRQRRIFWITMGPGQSGMYMIHLVGRWPSWWYCPLQGGFSTSGSILKGWIFILASSPSSLYMFCKPTITDFLDSLFQKTPSKKEEVGFWSWHADTGSRWCRKSSECPLHWTQALDTGHWTQALHLSRGHLDYKWAHLTFPINHKQYRFETIIKIIESSWPSFTFFNVWPIVGQSQFGE